MIARYSRPEMAAIFTDAARFGRWLEIELLATEAWAALGVVPPPTPPRAGPQAPVVDDAFVAAVAERERVTDHDVAAFVDVVQAAIGGPAGRVDPLRAHVVRRRRHRAGAGRCRDAADLLLDAVDALVAGAASDGPSSTATRR